MQLIMLGILWQLSELVMPVPQFSKAVDSSMAIDGLGSVRVFLDGCEMQPHTVCTAIMHLQKPPIPVVRSWWSPKSTLQDPNCLGGRVCMRQKKAGILLALPFLIPNVTTIAVRKIWATKAPWLLASLLNRDHTHAAHLAFVDKKVLSVHGDLCVSCGLGFASATEEYKTLWLVPTGH